MTRARRLTAEGFGTALLLAGVVGSGIMGERLAGGNVGIALLANTLATGAILVALILTFGLISGAHFNPAVTLVEAWQGGLAWGEVPGYVIVQVIGAFAGVALAHLMFEHPLFAVSLHERAGAAQLLSEFVATFGLVAVVRGCGRRQATAFAVGAYIAAAYWFTASTSFANPAVTLARGTTDTFAGIRPVDAPGFIAAQVLGAATAAGLFAWLRPTPVKARRVVPTTAAAPGAERPA
jgi:glycerol uptake facilitator-like aquaporin